MGLPLLPGKTVRDAIAVCEELATSNSSYFTNPNHMPSHARDDYVQWAINVEDKLRATFRAPEVYVLIDTPRHRDICTAHLGQHLVPMINAELAQRGRDLKAEADRFREMQTRTKSAPGKPLVLDTNALLEYQPFDQLTWKQIMGGPARLMIPLRVLEEVNAKKYSDSKRLRRRARILLRIEERLRDSSGPATFDESNGHTIEVVLPDRPRRHYPDADEEIIDVALELQTVHDTVKLATGDTGMRLRAKALGANVVDLPVEWRHKSDDEVDDAG